MSIQYLLSHDFLSGSLPFPSSLAHVGESLETWLGMYMYLDMYMYVYTHVYVHEQSCA